MNEEMMRLNSKLYGFKSKDIQLNKDAFEGNDDKTKFYTGLPNFLVLMQVFELYEPFISQTHRSVLGKFEQFILVLMRLRSKILHTGLKFH